MHVLTDAMTTASGPPHPVVPDVLHWAAAPALWTLTALRALTVFAFVASRGGQPLSGAWLDDRAAAGA